VVEENPIMTAARTEVLRRIRAALLDVSHREKPGMVRVRRDYLTSDPSPPAERVARFLERVAEYKAKIRSVTAADLPAAIAAALGARGVRTLVVPADLPGEWLAVAGSGSVRVLRDAAPSPSPSLSYEQIESSDGVLTAAALGIAQTGTVVLDGGPGQGRRALTLLPDYHLCVIRADQIVGLVPEAVAQLHAAAGNPGRPITLISGPSATSDIELDRVEGVHGPRTLEVLVVSDPSS
jgi:L-lactate dehydrogenase complex protein LldG